MSLIYILAGPTAAGKTAVSIQLAQRMGAEVVSADSVQVYRRLDIGSAKPTLEERQGIPHHMMDVLDAGRTDAFTVAEYQKMAFDCIEDIHARRKQVLVVGGTGLYIRALCEPMDFSGVNSNTVLREEWAQREGEKPGAAHEALAKIDPEAAKTLHPNDSKRVIRALEINETTGKTLAEHHAMDRCREPRYRSRRAALDMERAQLYQRVDKRAEEMFTQGLREEVQGLLAQGVSPSATSMQGIGYKETIDWIEGRCSKEEAIAQIQQATRKYAKRQWTWFRKDREMQWFDVQAYANADELSDALYQYYMGENDGSWQR